MVELPSHERKPARFSSLSRSFRQWLERDLNESRPLSLTLAAIPFLPGWLASELELVETVTEPLFVLGALLAVGWVGYVIFRRFGVIARHVRRTFSDAEARKRGEELPTRCPECSIDLPTFQPPADGKLYRFQGWTCENCGTMLDEMGHRI